MAAPTLASVSLGVCTNIRDITYTNIIQIPMPTQDSDSTEVFDMLGVKREIILMGHFTGANIAATKTAVDNIRALADKEQTATVDFSSEQLGEGANVVAVMISEFETNWDTTSAVKTDYILKLYVGVKT